MQIRREKMIRVIFCSLISFICVGYADIFPNDNTDLIGLVFAWCVFLCAAVFLQCLALFCELILGRISIEFVDEDEEDEE